MGIDAFMQRLEVLGLFAPRLLVFSLDKQISKHLWQLVGPENLVVYFLKQILGLDKSCLDHGSKSRRVVVLCSDGVKQPRLVCLCRQGWSRQWRAIIIRLNTTIAMKPLPLHVFDDLYTTCSDQHGNTI